ncbi:MAG: hypothetical protein GXP13_00320 [Gammaproteobacteria bacterium]|nr:hypothetical protein [Gammaproteobacteria bacterium]
MNNENQVIIRAPKQQEHRNPEALINPGEVRQWLDTLPILKPDPTIRLIADALESINLQKIPAKKRSQLLHEYRKTILQTFPSLSLDTLNRYSLNKKASNQVQIESIRLTLTLADGYKIIIRDALNDETATKDETISLSLYRAMESLSLAVLNCYRTYKSTPENLYNDIHQIYLLSEHLGLLTQEMENHQLNLSASSIGGIYRQIMSLAFLDPFHMPLGIAEKLYNRLSRYAKYCTILSNITDQDSSSIFVVDLATDEAPRAIYKITSFQDIKTPRVFDTHLISNKIKAEITALQTENLQTTANKYEEQLLSRLIPPDKEKRTRQAERVNSNRTCKVTFGIDAAYHFLTLTKHELAQVLTSTADNFGGHSLKSWVVNNESDTGFSLSSTTTQHNVSVGDIIGLLTETNNVGESQGRIATIKWIQNNQDHHVNIGVELIQGNILPASCRLIDEPAANDIFSAIFITSDTVGGTPATLITPKSVYQRGRIMEVTIAEQPMKIEAGFLQDDTFSFDRFDFTSIQS